MERWIAAFLQLMAAALFIFIGAEGDEAFLLAIPAFAAGVSGLLLWSRRQNAPPALAAPAERSSIEGKVDRIEDTLGALQSEIARLREDREFYRALYEQDAKNPQLNA